MSCETSRSGPLRHWQETEHVKPGGKRRKERRTSLEQSKVHPQSTRKSEVSTSNRKTICWGIVGGLLWTSRFPASRATAHVKRCGETSNWCWIQKLCLQRAEKAVWKTMEKHDMFFDASSDHDSNIVLGTNLLVQV